MPTARLRDQMERRSIVDRFEEADVLFDDDQGFFQRCRPESTTKRPIVDKHVDSIDGLPDQLPTLNSAFQHRRQ